MPNTWLWGLFLLAVYPSYVQNGDIPVDSSTEKVYGDDISGDIRFETCTDSSMTVLC